MIDSLIDLTGPALLLDDLIDGASTADERRRVHEVIEFLARMRSFRTESMAR